MALPLVDKPLTLEFIINRIAHLPELLRDCAEDEEAEALDCLIVEMTNQLNKPI